MKREYPTLEQVNAADRKQLGEWYRFLPSPGMNHLNSSDFTKHLEQEAEIMDRIVDRFREMGSFTPELSKSVGWEP